MEAADFLALLDTVDQATADAAASCADWSVDDTLAVARRMESLRRSSPVLDHHLIHRLEGSRFHELAGQRLADVLVGHLRISTADACARLDAAEHLGPRRAFTGEPLAPALPHVAAAQAVGGIGADHIAVIRDFLTELPAHLSPAVRDDAEATLAHHAKNLDPDHLRVVARQLMAYVSADGEEPADTERRRRRRRTLTMGPQDADGMSRITGYVTPEARAYLEAGFAKLAAPGMANPEDPKPCVDTEPEPEQVRTDHRTPGQRRHDALTLMARAILASGQLGQHHGLPVSVVANATLQELERGTGMAVTGGGTLLPMRDLIRMASHAYHYLAVFDEHTQLPLYLGRTRRIASAAQRLVLYALDRGCTRPGCTAPAYWCEVDHLQPWAEGGRTDIVNTGLACGPDNREKHRQGWTTHREQGRVHWTPPSHAHTAPGRPRVNHYHHPHEYLTTRDDPDGDDDPEKPGAA